jgi:hypothetical protein
LNDKLDDYIVPRGWVGIGITLPKRWHNENIWGNPVTFHGTNPDLVSDILFHGTIGMPGDVLINGTLLTSLNCAGRIDQNYYTSPTIAYSGLQLYAQCKKFQYGTEKLWGQIVLQCKQKPSSVLKKQEETMGFGHAGCTFRVPAETQPPVPSDHLCPHVSLFDPAAGIEVLSESPEECYPYRLCVRIFRDGHPPDISSDHDSAIDSRGKRHETFRSPVDGSPGTMRGKNKWH